MAAVMDEFPFGQDAAFRQCLTKYGTPDFSAKTLHPSIQLLICPAPILQSIRSNSYIT